MTHAPRHIRTIRVPARPNLDKIVMIWMLRKFLFKEFPGIHKAKIEEVTDGGGAPAGKTADERELEGELWLDVGGGRFDPHPRNGEPGLANECGATVLARTYALDQDPALAAILEYTRQDDTKGGKDMFSLAQLVKFIHSFKSANRDAAMEWAGEALEAVYQNQVAFFEKGRQAFRKAHIEKVGGHTIVVGQTDEESFGAYARSMHGARASVVIQKRSDGHVQIFGTKRDDPPMERVAQFIRAAEQRNALKIVTNDWDDLAKPGTVPGVANWYFQPEGRMILNGSLSHQHVTPTALGLDVILSIVRTALVDEDYWARRNSMGTFTSKPRPRNDRQNGRPHIRRDDPARTFGGPPRFTEQSEAQKA